MKHSLILLTICTIGGCTVENPDNGDSVLFKQTGTVHKVGKGLDVDVQDHVIKVAMNQQRPAPLRISARVKTERVTGPTGRNLLIVTNIHYDKTPVFWDTILYPQTGTHPWQYCERYVRSRLPIESLEIHFRLTDTNGQAWFKDFTVEEVPEWPQDDDCVVAMLGDSTDMVCYIEDSLKLHRHLEMLLTDRFPDSSISVRNLAESGDYLERLLASGRLERELDTLRRCDIMIIRYGLNDQGHQVPPEDFRKQLRETCDKVLKKFPDARIVLSTTIPPFAPEMSETSREVAAERAYPLVDVEKFLAEHAALGNSNWHTGPMTQVGFPSEENPRDNPTGLKANKHPNIYGSRLIAEQVYRVIEPIVALMLGKQG